MGIFDRAKDLPSRQSGSRPDLDPADEPDPAEPKPDEPREPDGPEDGPEDERS